jgi:hypothetical protein
LGSKRLARVHITKNTDPSCRHRASAGFKVSEGCEADQKLSIVPDFLQYPNEVAAMSDSKEDTSKTHYICQTYIETKGARGAQAGLKIDKQFQYSTEAQAKDRAERESQLEDCAGADAYMIVEDASSGEVSSPSFIVRLGNVPEFDDF